MTWLVGNFSSKKPEELSDKERIDIGLALRQIGIDFDSVMILKAAADYIKDNTDLSENFDPRDSHLKVDLL
jgi:hypothetical protein